MQDAGVDARMDHRRELARSLGLPALGPCTVGLVRIPVPGLGQRQSVRGLQPESGDVTREHEKARELLASGNDAEL